MKKSIQVTALALAAILILSACNKEKESFNAKLKFGGKDNIDVLGDYTARPDTAVGHITKKGTHYTGGTGTSDSAATSNRIN